MGQVTEILGFTSTKRDQVYIRVWENKLNRPLEYGDVLTISTDTYSTGGGTNIIRSVQKLFTTEKAEAVTMTCDTKGVRTQPRLFRTYQSTRWQLAPTNFLPTPADDSLVQLITNTVHDNGINQCKIFTDGSYTDNNSALAKILESPDLSTPSATAGIVITDASDQWKQRPVISVHFAHDNNVNATSVFHMECMALTLALALSDKGLNCQGIYTDSESAYKLIKHPRRITLSSHAPLTRIFQRHTSRVRNLVQHIHSHSEQMTRDKSKWTHEMHGNHLADRAAADDTSSLQNLQHIHINTLKTGHILTLAQREPH
jgi:ribonuclease HI